jgi:hypothetical protein
MLRIPHLKVQVNYSVNVLYTQVKGYLVRKAWGNNSLQDGVQAQFGYIKSLLP